MKHTKASLNLTSPSNKLAILGLLIRLVPAAFTAHPSDITAWKTIGAAIYHGQNPYTLPAFGLVYPPLWGLVCSVAYTFYLPTQNSFVFNFLIKLPIIAVDIAMAKTIERIVLTTTRNQRTALEAMMLYLFNPMTIILSAFRGMFDAIPAFLVLLSMILLYRKQYLKSSLALGVGIAFKGAYPALLLPLFLYTIMKTEGKGKTLGYLASSMLIPVITSVPFVVANAASYFNMIITHNVQGQLSNLTYWLVIRSVFYQNQEILSAISLVIFITAFSTLYAFVLWKADPKLIIRSIILVILIFFLTAPTVNEEYFVWLLPSMIICATTEIQRLKIYVYALTTIVTVYAIARASAPVLVICSLAFPVVSAAALRETKKAAKKSALGHAFVAPEAGPD